MWFQKFCRQIARFRRVQPADKMSQKFGGGEICPGSKGRFRPAERSMPGA
jgi:hypothetical protein